MKQKLEWGIEEVDEYLHASRLMCSSQMEIANTARRFLLNDHTI